MRELSNGSDAAFSTLYHGYIDAVYGLSLLYLKQPALAEEIPQAVFLKIWEQREKLPGLESFTKWLFIVSRNHILDTLRRHAVERNYRQYIKERMELEPAVPAGEEFIDAGTYAIIKDAINKLPPQQQKAFTLQREEGLSYEQIAERMGVAVNTVRKHLHLALTSIREYVQAHSSETQLMIVSLLFSDLLAP